jgi:hypothetical protein
MKKVILDASLGHTLDDILAIQAAQDAAYGYPRTDTCVVWSNGRAVGTQLVYTAHATDVTEHPDGKQWAVDLVPIVPKEDEKGAVIQPAKGLQIDVAKCRVELPAKAVEVAKLDATWAGARVVEVSAESAAVAGEAPTVK